MRLPADEYFKALENVLSKRYDKSEYSFQGYKECAVCIQYIDYKWHVYEGERGNHNNELICDTPLETCISVIHKMTNVSYDIFCMEDEFIERLSEKNNDIKSNITNIKYWIYEFEMSDETLELINKVCSQLRLTRDELFDVALKYAVRQAEEDPEGFKRSCLEAEQSSDIDIKQIRSYPVYKGETEAIALDRKLKEEAESNE